MKKASEKRSRTRHAEPSKASLKEIPEVDFTKARVGLTLHAALRQAILAWIERAA